MKKSKIFFLGFQRGIKDFGDNLTAIVNTGLLLIVYLVGVGLTSSLAKIIGKKFLDQNIDKNKATYWSDINLGKKEIEEYYRQF